MPEDSIMLYLYPELVMMNKLKKRDVIYVPFFDQNMKMKNYKRGILADPFHFSIKKGRIMVQIFNQKYKIFN